VSLALITSNAYFDVGGTAIIGVLLVVVAIILSIEVKSLLIGESASKESIGGIRAAIESTPGVTQIIHLKTLHIGPEEILVAAKIGVDAGASAADVTAVIDAAERNLRAADPMAQQVFLEPDIYRADHVPDERPAPPSAPSH
jgi:divalent metal cation (Fe/Co/Zn/Cd) transporter